MKYIPLNLCVSVDNSERLLSTRKAGIKYWFYSFQVFKYYFLQILLSFESQPYFEFI